MRNNTLTIELLLLFFLILPLNNVAIISCHIRLLWQLGLNNSIKCSDILLK